MDFKSVFSNSINNLDKIEYGIWTDVNWVTLVKSYRVSEEGPQCEIETAIATW